MSRACLSPLRLSNLALSAALIFLVSACAGSSTLYDYLTVAPAETQVWNDFMPGSKPSCNAMLRLSVTNASDSTVTLTDPEMIVMDAATLNPLRRFPAVLTIDDQRARSVTIKPGSTAELAFRSPGYGLEPIDGALFPRVRVSIRMNSSLDLPLMFRGPIVDLFETH